MLSERSEKESKLNPARCWEIQTVFNTPMLLTKYKNVALKLPVLNCDGYGTEMKCWPPTVPLKADQ
jgi:hypothetical protein